MNKSYSCLCSKDNTEVLKDASSTGKERDWRGKKKRSLLMADHFYHASDKHHAPHLARKGKRMEDCCDILTFKLTDVGLKLYQAYLCKVRLCPMCNWRRSLKIAWQNKQIVETANAQHKLRWLFLTLTVENPTEDKLKATVEHMQKSWNRFVGYKRIKGAVKGYFRALEITKNRNPHSKSYGTYHPHYHVLLCVSPSYFTHGYIKKSEWVELWKKAAKLDYPPIIDIRPVKPKHDAPDLEGIENEIKQAIREQNAILEVSKYPVKDADILPTDKLTADGVDTVYTLDDAMAYKRLIGYGGLLKEIRKQLQLDDPEEGDLIRTSDDDPTANAIAEVIAYWHPGIKNYVIKD